MKLAGGVGKGALRHVGDPQCQQPTIVAHDEQPETRASSSTTLARAGIDCIEFERDIIDED